MSSTATHHGLPPSSSTDVREGIKLSFNAFKQIAVFSSAIIALLVSLLDSDTNSTFSYLTDWAFGLLALSLVTSVVALVSMGAFLSSQLQSLSWGWVGKSACVVALTSFVASILVLAAYGLFTF